MFRSKDTKKATERYDTGELSNEQEYDVFRQSEIYADDTSGRKAEKASVFEWFKINSKKENFTTLLIVAVTYFISFYIFGMILILISRRALSIPSKLPIVAPWNFITALYGYGSASVFISTLILAVASAVFAGKKYMDYIKLRDNNFIIRSKKGIYGNADWMTNRPKELAATLDVSDNLKRPGYIPLGIYKDRVYSIPEKPSYDQIKNMNIAVIGASGIGKSYSFIGPLIEARIAYGESFIVTDTKGDIYKTYANACKEFGFDVQVFNTSDWRYTTPWDCMEDLVNASEAEIFEYVDVFANVFIKNTSHDEREDYWMKNEHDLLRGCMHLVARDRSFEGRRTFAELIDLINGPLEEIDAYFQASESKVQAAARNFMSAKDPKLRDNYRSGLANRLQVFKSILVKTALSRKGINFESAIHKPTAIFLITKDDSSAYDAATSLFVASLYSKLIQITKSPHYKNKLKVPFWIITDELCNMAAIDDLSKKISTNRSRNIRICLAIQSLSQLDATYKGLAMNIINNCGIVTFLGGADEDTVKMIVERCGTYTQVLRQRREERHRFFRLRFKLQYQETETYVQKNLFESYEASQLETGTIIHLILGKSPFKGKSYPEDEHEVHEYVTEANLTENYPEWYQDFCADHPEFIERKEKDFSPSAYELDEERTPSYTPEERRRKDVLRSIPPEAKIESYDVMEEIARRREEARLASQERIRAQFEKAEENPVSEPKTELIKPSDTENMKAPPGDTDISQDKTSNTENSRESSGEDFDPFENEALDELFG